ncbi:hypothetical protein OPV22_011597 [Ensete ventricosum]|uniref:BZIP domain-containing protein n=1 Tax=Ensete ventricosum TaxID=4639 RepID=A0AAV8RG27_ENSVE|nr:hypothetical protein OPV22_011597 [Ensete ventricosum]
MAQLPPKTPNAATNWHASVHQNNFCMGTADSWVDEFLDFSAAKRAAHRRSASDSIAFLEAPVETVGGGGGHEFGRLDDDQLMSMFSDEAPHSSSDAVPIDSSNPPLQTSDDDHPDGEKIEEKQQQLYEAASLSQIGRRAEAKLAAASEQIVDPKRVKRILANRQSAQRSRVRKLQYISELERSVTSLETEVSALSPRVAFLDQQRSLLTLGNSHLKQRIAALAQDKIFKDAHQEALKKEIERLRQVYYQQSLEKMADGTTTTSSLRGEKKIAFVSPSPFLAFVGLTRSAGCHLKQCICLFQSPEMEVAIVVWELEAKSNVVAGETCGINKTGFVPR